MKFLIAMNSIGEKYSQQWFANIYKELRNNEHFQQTITEYLWSPQIQSPVHCWIYQDRSMGCAMGTIGSSTQYNSHDRLSIFINVE